MESLSLIDAVMPDVVTSRQGQQKPPVVKNELTETNGEEGCMYMIYFCLILFIFPAIVI